MSNPQVFREVFQHATKELLHWFPGHMAKGMRTMQAKLRSVDGIIEVHDARIPFSGRNNLFKEKISMVRPHLFVLNKTDLADLSRKEEIIDKLKEEGISDVMLTDCKQNSEATAQQIVPRVMEMIKSTPRYDRSNSSPSIYQLLVIGVPNVGKSSLINILRNIHMKKGGKPANVGANPGVTRAVQTGIHICHRPNIYVLDTPGIAHPSVPDIDAGMKLALCHILQDNRIGEEIVADFLLFWLNKHKDFRYVKTFGLDKPTDNVTELLVHIAATKNMFNRIRPVAGGPWIERVDLNSAARWILGEFRAGKLGKIMLDEDQLLPAHDPEFYRSSQSTARAF